MYNMETMLTIKKVPTVVSNYQENVDSSKEVEEVVRGCGRRCLGKCCLPVAELPLFAFNDAEQKKYDREINGYCEGECPEMCFLNNLLLGQWEDRVNKGLFRYDITACETKVISGKYGFIAQLNEGRHLKKRPTEFRIDRVIQPFDENKFNFTKVGQEEVLFRFEPSKDNRSRYLPTSAVNVAEGSPSVVAINVSPIEYGHVLLIPRVLECLPQKIDRYGLQLALHFAREASNPFFRVGYNSLGAFATINHLHFQAYYLAMPFPIEKAPTCRIMSSKGPNDTRIFVSELLNYPVRGLVFEGGSKLCDLADAVASSCVFLQDSNIPFNLLISGCGERIFLLPQCYAEKQARGAVNQQLLETQVNPAVWEISGHMVLKRKKDYEEASEQCAWRLLAEVSLSEESFEYIKRSIREAANLQSEEEYAARQHESGRESPLSRVTSCYSNDCLVLY